MSRSGTTSRLGTTVLAATAVLLMLAGCAAPAPTARLVTEDEADRIADVLYTNYQDKGATFSINGIGRENKPITINGEIDFANGAGRATVQTAGTDAAVVEVAWLGSNVVERIPALSQLAEARGDAPITWVSRPVDTATYDIDRELAILIGLASQVRENPLLLRQNGVQWVRSDTLRGVDVDVFQYGDTTRFWVKHDSSRLLRFEGNNAALSAPVVIDLTEPGAHEIELPTLDETVPVDTVADLYKVAREQR